MMLIFHKKKKSIGLCSTINMQS